VNVGEFTAGFLIQDQVIVELKVVGALSDAHMSRCRNDPRAIGEPPCPLIDFGRAKIEIRAVTARAGSRNPFHPNLSP
jgi:hypothetical protein